LRDKIDTLVAESRRKLLTPDFDGFEMYYGCPVPPELRQFYDLKERLLAGVLYATCATSSGPVRFDLIQYAEPMNRENWSRRCGSPPTPMATGCSSSRRWPDPQCLRTGAMAGLLRTSRNWISRLVGSLPRWVAIRDVSRSPPAPKGTPNPSIRKRTSECRGR
jgi:hypothetical protein